MPSRSLLRQIVFVDFRLIRPSRCYQNDPLTKFLRPLEAFIQEARECLSLFEVGNIADLVCLKAIVSLTFVRVRSDGLVAAQTARFIDWARLTDVKPCVAFRSNDNVCVSALYSKESGKVEVSSIKDIDAPGLNEHPIHKVNIMHRTVCDLYEDWDRNGQVDLSVEFDCRFGFTEMSPRKHRQAKINRGGIDRINHLVNIESVRVFAIKSPRLTNQDLCECFANTQVAILVRMS